MIYHGAYITKEDRLAAVVCRYSPLAAAQVLPLAFVAKCDEEKDVAALWGEVWEEATTGGAAALRLYAADIVPLIIAGEPSSAPTLSTG